MTTPYLQDPDFTLYCGDVLDVLRELPDESVDCCITSPPYWGLRDYGVPGQLGLEPTPDEWVARMVEVFREVRRVLAGHGTCWVNIGDSYAANTQGSPKPEMPHTKGKVAGYVPNAWSGITATPVKHPTKPKDLCGMPWRLAFALQQPYYTGRIKGERDRIWLAATIEAEGCLFIHKRKEGQPNGQGYVRKNDSYGAGLEVASTDRAVVERCLEITGLGSICEQTPKQNNRRKQTIYRWNLRSNVCREVIRELYPHFIAKQHEARLLLGCPSSGDDARRAHESLKALHQGGTPDIDFAAPKSMFEGGWYLRSDVIWSKKPNPMPESVTDRPTKAHEYVFLLTKEPRYFFDAEAVREPHMPDGRRKTTVQGRDGSIQHRDGERWPNSGRNIRSVWEIATQPFPEAHFATFPEELVRRALLAGCPEQVCSECGKPRERVDCGHDAYRPGFVLDPFMGTGTVALVARKHGRHSIGIELNPDYCKLAAKRLAQQGLLAA